MVVFHFAMQCLRFGGLGYCIFYFSERTARICVPHVGVSKLNTHMKAKWLSRYKSSH